MTTPDAQPVLHSTATDNNNPPLRMMLGHEVWNAARTSMVVNTLDPSGDEIASDSTGQWRVRQVLPNGTYSYRTAARNIYPGVPSRDLWGWWSGWYDFTVDATPPPNAPTVHTADDYPRGYWGAPNGAPGLIPVETPDADVAGYAYTFNGSGTETVPNNTNCDYHKVFGLTGGWIPNTPSTKEWIPVPVGLPAGYHTLHVKTFDDAHNMSPSRRPPSSTSRRTAAWRGSGSRVST